MSREFKAVLSRGRLKKDPSARCNYFMKGKMYDLAAIEKYFNE